MGGSFNQKQRNFSDRRKSGIMLLLEMGDAKSTSLAESQCAKGSAKAVNSANHKIYF